jgi:hypothetical protein
MLLKYLITNFGMSPDIYVAEIHLAVGLRFARW